MPFFVNRMNIILLCSLLLNSCNKNNNPSDTTGEEHFDVLLTALIPTMYRDSLSSGTESHSQQKCSIDAEERLILRDDPKLIRTASGQFFKITLLPVQNLKIPCALESGYVKADNFRRDYVQKPAINRIESAYKAGLELNTKTKIVVEDNTFIWPFRAGNLLSSFGHKNRFMHEGIDFELAPETPILASGDGQIVSARWGHGASRRRLQIIHHREFESRYEHNLESLYLALGKVVLKGDEIARFGTPLLSDAPKLHFEIRTHGRALNPIIHLPQRGHTEHHEPKTLIYNHDLFPKTKWTHYTPGQHFKTLNAAVSDKFESPEPVFRPHPSCRKDKIQLKSSFTENIKMTQLTGAHLIPDQGAIYDLNLYFTLNKRFHQLSMEPKSAKLDEYRISLIQSGSQDFSLDVVRIADGRLNQLTHLSRQEAGTQLKSLIEEFSAQGAHWGSRTTILAHLVLTEDSMQQDLKKSTIVEYHNGAIRGFMNDQQECHLSDDGWLECLCSSIN